MRCILGLSRRKGHSKPPSSICPGWRSSASTRSRSCRWASSPGGGGWGYDGVYISAAHSAYGGPAGFGRLVARRARRRPGRDPRRRLQPRRRIGDAGARGVRAVLHREVRDAVGARHELRRRRVRPGPRVGAPERHRLGARLRDRRPAAGRDPRDRRLERRAPRGRRRASRPPGAQRCGGDRRERPERSAGHARRGRRRLGLRRGLGGRLPPLAARADHRRAGGLLRGVRARRAAGQGVAPPARARRELLDLPPPALRRAGRRRAARPVRGLLPEPRPGRQPGIRRPSAGARRARWPRSARCSRRSCRSCSWARSTARTRPFSSSPTTSTRISPRPPGRAAATSSRRSPRSPRRRSPILRTRPRSSARS